MIFSKNLWQFLLLLLMKSMGHNLQKLHFLYIPIFVLYSHNTYQFPGGHVMENEELVHCLIREIEEETGMNLHSYSLTPFMKIVNY